MPLATAVSIAELVPKADTTNPEREAVPLDYSLVTTEETIPIATNHLQAITFFFVKSGAGNAEVYVRGFPGDAWALLDSNDLITLPTMQFTCPAGQLKVRNSGFTSLQIRAQGLDKQVA